MITVKEEEHCAILKPEMDIISSTVEELRDTITTQLQNNKFNITLDLSKVNNIDSIGLGTLISCYKALEELDGKLTFTSASDDLMLMFNILKLDEIFSISL